MRQYSIGVKLQEITKLSTQDGLKISEVQDIRLWRERTGEKNDTTCLSDKIVERICELFHSYFE